MSAAGWVALWTVGGALAVVGIVLVIIGTRQASPREVRPGSCAASRRVTACALALKGERRARSRRRKRRSGGR